MDEQAISPAVEISFHGAAGTVTGSCFAVKGNGKFILVDCGMFQGSRALEALNFEELPFDAHQIDAVVLTHAHLDHCGRLPYLVSSGCTAPIWMTGPTAGIIEPLLLDSAKLQASDVARRNRRPDRRGTKPFVPLYTPSDVSKTMNKVREAAYGQWVDLGDGDGFRFWDARHIVGSASIEIKLDGQRLLFSGDIGGGALIKYPGVDVGGYDYVICEATYGDRRRDPFLITDRREELAKYVEETLARHGNLLIPSFAIERTQVILEDLLALFETKRLAPVNVFVDSPLAEQVTRATQRYRSGGFDLMAVPNIRFTHSVEESKQLEKISGAIIIAGSGMCQGGRIRHHLLNNLPLAQSRILLVGYQVTGTLGAVLKDGAKYVRISGHDVPVRADVRAMDSYSTHADRPALRDWISQHGPISGSVFLVHGESHAVTALASDLQDAKVAPVILSPHIGETWTLNAGQAPYRSRPARADFDALVAARGWVSDLAAFESSLSDRLRALPTDAARQQAVAALAGALARAEGTSHASSRWANR
jgi:metallo-beta-lactamase family protein